MGANGPTSAIDNPHDCQLRGSCHTTIWRFAPTQPSPATRGEGFERSRLGTARGTKRR